MKSPAHVDSLSRSQFLLLLILSLVQFTNVLDFVLMMPLEPNFQREWSLSPLAYGALVSCYAFAACPAGFLAAGWLDRFDRRKALLLMYFGFAISNFLCGISDNYWMFLFARSMAGIFGGILGSVVLTIIGDVIPYSRRGFAMSVVMSAFSVASIIGIPIGLVIARYSSWRWAFLSLGIISALVWPLAFRTIPSVKNHLENITEHDHPWIKIGKILNNSNHLMAFLYSNFLVITTFMVIPYLAAYMVANVKIDEKDLPWIYITGGIGTLSTMAWFGKLSDRYGKLFMFRILAVIAIIPILITTHLPIVPLYVVLLVTTAFMIFTSARMIPAIAMITACAVPEQRAGFMSIHTSVQQFAMGLGATISSFTLTRGEGAQLAQMSLAGAEIHGYPIIGYYSVVAMMLSLILGGMLRPLTNKQPVSDPVLVAVD